VIERVRIQRFRLPLARPLVTGRGSVAAREGVLVALDGVGATGWGEASPLPGWPGETLAEAEAALAALGRAALGRGVDEVSAAAPCAPLARAAFETALVDLAARERGASLAAHLSGARARRAVALAALVDGETPEEIAAFVAAARRDGFRTFKLKVGAAPLARELERVAALREAAGPDARVRLDANGAWGEGDAEDALAGLARFAPEFVEEPVRGIEALARLRPRSPLPLALDESAAPPGALERALAARAADVLVLKPALLGGPRAARAAALRAREAGLAVAPTSFLDSALGVAAALHVAASLDATTACGLATGRLFAFDLAELRPEDGELALPDGPGLGVAPDAASLSRAACGPVRELCA
jgi:o-succinylbenzoate synthase